MKLRHLATLLVLLGCAAPARGQSGDRLRPVPVGYGSLTQDDLSLRVRNDEIEIRFMPLDPRLAPLMAPDAYQSLRSLLETHRRSIDSVAARAGVAQPGLALVSFFGQRPDVRFDAQNLILLIRNQVVRPLGCHPPERKVHLGTAGHSRSTPARSIYSTRRSR